MKRPYTIGEILVDLEEVAAVETCVRVDCGIRASFALVLRSGYKVHASDSSSEEGRRKLEKLRRTIIGLLNNETAHQ